MGFTQCEKDQCIFSLVTENGIIIVAIFVDDLLFFFNYVELHLSIKERLFKTFSMKDLGDVRKCFGLNAVRDRKNRIITLDQEEYMNPILKNFRMNDCEKCSTPMEEVINATLTKSESCDINLLYRSLVGSLMYSYMTIRPDIRFSVDILSKFSNSYQKEHWNEAKRVLRYLKEIIHYYLNLE